MEFTYLTTGVDLDEKDIKKKTKMRRKKNHFRASGMKSVWEWKKEQNFTPILRRNADMIISLDDARMCPLCANKQNNLKMQKFGKGQRGSAAFFSHDKDDVWQMQDNLTLSSRSV